MSARALLLSASVLAVAVPTGVATAQLKTKLAAHGVDLEVLGYVR